MTKFTKSLFTWLACGALLACNGATPAASRTAPGAGAVEPPPASSQTAAPVQNPFLDQLAEDTWAYLSSDWATANHMPWSWRSPSLSGGDDANPAEIGFYVLAWLIAYDYQQPWSPTWAQAEAEIAAVLDRLRAWQTGSQPEQPHGPNAYQNKVFYQWYWVSWIPPVVGDGPGNHLVPSVDNAWLAASLIVISQYAAERGYTALAHKAQAILDDMDFTLWYHPDVHRFAWGTTEDPQGGTLADFYSNENRIINFVARALGQLNTDEYLLSLQALEAPSGSYAGILVEKVNWDVSLYTYLAPALFIREVNTGYGKNTIVPAILAQIQYARDHGYVAWGLSDNYDILDGGYVQQGAPPSATTGPTETVPGLVTPHASALALITPLYTEAITNLQVLSDTFPPLYQPGYGFLDSVMADPDDPDSGKTSSRYAALDQEWIFLANTHDGFLWQYFYRHPGVRLAYREMFGETWVFLPSVRIR